CEYKEARESAMARVGTILGGALGAAGLTVSVAGQPCAAGWGSSFGEGTSGEVLAYAIFDPDGSGPLAPRLVIAGDFFAAGGGGLGTGAAGGEGGRGVARDAGLMAGPCAGRVSALAFVDDPSSPALFAAGRFEVASGASLAAVWRWNGSAWVALPTPPL